MNVVAAFTTGHLIRNSVITRVVMEIIESPAPYILKQVQNTLSPQHETGPVFQIIVSRPVPYSF